MYCPSILFFTLSLLPAIHGKFKGPLGRENTEAFSGVGRPGDLPPFLVNISREGKQAFMKIFQDQSKTKAWMKSAVDTWATTYGLTDQAHTFEDEMKKKMTDRRANITEAIGQLNEALTKIYAIEDNQEISPVQTEAQIREAVDGMSSELRGFVLAATGPPKRSKGPAGFTLGPLGPNGPLEPIGPMGRIGHLGGFGPLGRGGF